MARKRDYMWSALMGMLMVVSWDSVTDWAKAVMKRIDWAISMEVLKGVEWGVSLTLACM
jgi:hypothetical protein